ncbi:hypothetical protein BDR04DRAFT_1092932 [Suillus decipiens]|nr:hypothetical protein BDR04DRAFT_1092932 [Suillus decipiens]
MSSNNFNDEDFFKTWLNNILRAADRPNVGQNIVQPVQIQPLERDHFFEVQHIVTLIMEDGNWMQTPIGQYIDLATFVNDVRNIFRIERALNQAKKNIPFNTYPNNAQIAAYRRFQVNLQNGTVDGEVRWLANEMATRQGANAALTQRIGRRIKQIMGWP